METLRIFTPFPVVSPLAHPALFIQQILMVTGVRLLTHWSGGGMQQGPASLRPAAVDGGDASSIWRRRGQGFQEQFPSWGVDTGVPPGPSPGTLDTHHWGGRCF